jgi:predicted transcriptional regulator of viral defense system
MLAAGRLAHVAEAQCGLVTTRQAEMQDVARRDLSRMVHSGALERVAHGVYRVCGAPRPALLELRAAWLQLAPGAAVDRRTPGDGVVSHASAAMVYGVGLLNPFRHEFSVPNRRVRSRRPDVVIHRVPLRDADVRWAHELLVTVPVRTVADLCSAVTDGEHLSAVVVDILDKRLATRRELIEVLAAHAASYGITSGSGREFLGYLLSFAP